MYTLRHSTAQMANWAPALQPEVMVSQALTESLKGLQIRYVDTNR